MRTFAALTGGSVVFATLQVTVCAEPAAKLTAVFGVSTGNGPAVFATTTAVLASLVPPPPAWLSRTVTRKFKVRVAFGSSSAVMQSRAGHGDPLVSGGSLALSRIQRRLGKVRVGSGLGAGER